MIKGFPGGTVGKNLSANAGDARETRSTPGSRICPQNRKWQPTPVFLLGKLHGQRSLQPMESQRVRHDRAHTQGTT